MKKYRRIKSKKRTRKKKSFISRFYFPILGLVVFSGIIIYSFFYFSPRLEIKNLEISGLTGVPEEDLSRAVKDKFTVSYSLFGQTGSIENIFLPSAGKIDSILKEFPQIESINLKKDYATGSLYLDVKEKTPFAEWRNGSSSCFLVGETGDYIKDCVPGENLGIRITDKDKTCEENGECRKTMLSAAKKISGVATSFSLQYGDFYVYSAEKLSLAVSGGCEFIFNPAKDIDWQIEELNIVLAKYFERAESCEYIDLRYDRVYIK
ncbi:MAG: hypothetical protein PHG23_03650 [Candidatus Pacebacteria bacterium]|nr:hypothetical protein [Candidatus Paceibacterota bacterium]